MKVRVLRLCPGCFKELLSLDELKRLAERLEGAPLYEAALSFADVARSKLLSPAFGFLPFERYKGEYDGCDAVLYALCEACDLKARRRKGEFAFEVARNIAILVAKDGGPEELKKSVPSVALEVVA